MDRRTLRAFALGVFLTASIIGSYYFYFSQKISVPGDTALEKKHLENHGYIVMKKNEYQKQKNPSGNNQPSKAGIYKKNSISLKKENVNVPSPIIPKAKKEYSYYLVVTNGMNSDQIAHLLFKQKIIADEKAFVQFIITKQYEKKIQLGSYDVSSSMSFDQIAKIITKTSK